jgi:type III secretory pathway component EscV
LLWVPTSENAARRRLDQMPHRPLQHDLELRIGAIRPDFA